MNKIGVLDFAVKINILSGEFEFDCLRCIILLRPLYTSVRGSGMWHTLARIFFPGERITYRHRGKFPQFMYRPYRILYILNIDIYYIEASVTRDRTVTDDRNTPIRTGVNGDVGEEGQGDVYPAKWVCWFRFVDDAAVNGVNERRIGSC